jgi:parallel beta-helix repeat protein
VLLASDNVYNPVEDVIIDNVAIHHGAWNINRTQQADGASAGFLHNAAFFVANASSIVISDVEISHTGSYGLWINSGTLNINFMNSLITDMGAGGIWVGRTLTPMPKRATFVKIISNEISYGGNVFPSGVGIDVGASLGVVISDNSIHHHRYNGISVGNSLGYGPSGLDNIIIEGNYIYDIGLHVLNDQGAIYTIGVLPGMLINGNVVKNVYSYAILMWGIYLDEGSSDILVSNNVVYNTGWGSLFQHYGANNTIINNVFARASLNPPPQPGDNRPDGYVRIGLAENHTSWTFTRNIIYDTYQGSNHTVYRPTNGTIAPFTNNVYYNVYGAQLLFGYQQLSFADWQKTGQDNNSVIADPLFAGDVNQCDFFTVQANSPAAKLGFINLTKLSKWTPGCDADDQTIYTQFYHW